MISLVADDVSDRCSAAGLAFSSPPQPHLLQFPPYPPLPLPFPPSCGSHPLYPGRGSEWALSVPLAGPGGTQPPNAYCCIWRWKLLIPLVTRNQQATSYFNCTVCVCHCCTDSFRTARFVKNWTLKNNVQLWFNHPCRLPAAFLCLLWFCLYLQLILKHNASRNVWNNVNILHNVM